MEVSKLITEISECHPASGMNVNIIAIDGHGGSGKSTLAAKLANGLGAQILHTDDFASWDNPYNWWPTLIENALEPIKRGVKALSYERSSWGPEHHPESVRDQPVTSTMILEGVSSARKEFRPYLAYSIWVDAPKEVCIARGVERDGEKMRQQWEKWWADEEKYIAEHSPQDYVDIRVSGV